LNKSISLNIKHYPVNGIVVCHFTIKIVQMLVTDVVVILL